MLGGCYGGSAAFKGESQGNDGDPGGDGDGDGDGDEELVCDDMGLTPLRRISAAQYDQILQDLLPAGLYEAAAQVSQFPPTTISDGFTTYATANTVSTSESIAIEDNAEAIAEVFANDLDTYGPQLVPCLSSGFANEDIDGCIDGFISEFGERAFRRPLTEGESGLVRDLYDAMKVEDTARDGLVAVLHFFLQSPALLYMVERGQGQATIRQLTPNEMATRLSLFLTNGLPDDELRAAVSEGRLLTREDVQREARRILDRPGTAKVFGSFHHEWMKAYALDASEREHPEWSTDVHEALAEELQHYGEWLYSETDGSFQTLMTSTAFPKDPRLAAIYGDSPRMGVLTTAATMSAHAHEDRTSLIERAAFIRTSVLCAPPPPFPGEIDIETPLEDFSDLPTQRERLEPLMTNGNCSGCHQPLNPFGFPFEVYDWAGAYRTTENGANIDTSADVPLAALAGSYADAPELIEAIAGSDLARDCYATHWFRYALGRPEALEDECILDEIKTDFAEANGDIRELLVAIVSSDAFLFRKEAE